MSKKKLRAVLYLRVSDARDRETGKHLNVRSVSEQESELRARGDRENWDVVAVFIDNDRSASRYAKKSRGDFADMVKYLEAGNADLVGAWESSRYQRDLAVYVQLRDLCHRNNVLYDYSGRTYDLSRTDDRFATGLDALLAERESDVTRDRIMRGVRTRVESGKPHGKIPWGYTREYDPKTKEYIRQVEIPEIGKLFREAKDSALNGRARGSIIRGFEARGIAPPRDPLTARPPRWHLTTLTRLLTNPTYAGLRTHKGEIVGKADWDGMITVEEWRALCTLFGVDDHKGRSGPREAAVVHMLTGIALCGVGYDTDAWCAGRTVVQMNRGTPGYICAERWHLSRHEAKVDQVVNATVSAWLARPDAVADLSRRGDDETARAARDEAATLRARLDAFYDQGADGRLTAQALVRIEQKLMPQIKAAEARARAALPLPSIVDELAGNADTPNVWPTLDLHQKRVVIKALFTIVILPAGKGARTFDPRLILVIPKFGSTEAPFVRGLGDVGE